MPGGVAGLAGAVSALNSCSLVAMYPSPGSAPGMKYAFGVPGSILNTAAGGNRVGLSPGQPFVRLPGRGHVSVGGVQIAEHVIEGPVLQHQHHDVLD